jgi:hypothetical protein
MKTSFAFSAVVGAALIAISGSSMAAADVQANVEIDNTSSSGSAVASGSEGLSQGGRVEVNIAGKAGESGFVAGRATLIAGKGGAATTDDMWVQLGNATGDVKLGRFEAADLFPLINDTMVGHAGNVYAANNLRGRIGGNAFQAAGTLNLGSSASLEIGVIDATKTDLAGAAFPQNTGVNAKGVRAVLSFGSGALSGRIGVESGQYKDAGTGANKVQGFGLTATYDAGSFKVTGNYAKGQQDAAANNNESAFGLSVGVGGFGAGYVAATNDQAGGDIKVNTAYLAYSIPLFGVKGASVTPAFSTSTVKDSVAGTSKDLNSVRVRVHYDF